LGSFSDDEMAPREAAPVHRNVVCDVTEAVIAGVRFKKKGLEYDLFEAEFEKAEQLEYEVIKAPGEAPVDAADWSTVSPAAAE